MYSVEYCNFIDMCTLFWYKVCDTDSMVCFVEFYNLSTLSSLRNLWSPEDYYNEAIMKNFKFYASKNWLD